MVVQNTVRTYGVNKVFQFVEGTWLHRKSRQIRKCFRKRPILLHARTTCCELPSYTFTMVVSDDYQLVRYSTTLYKKNPLIGCFVAASNNPFIVLRHGYTLMGRGFCPLFPKTYQLQYQRKT